MIGNSKISNPGAAGGLDIVADVLVEDGAVTEFGAPDVGFVDGGVYEFTATVEQNGAGVSTTGWLFDSDEVAANYTYGSYIYSGVSPAKAGTHQFAGQRYSATNGDTINNGDKAHSTLRVKASGTALHCEYARIIPTSHGLSTIVHLIGYFTYDSGTLPTQVGVLSSLASGIANGSTIKGVRLY